MSTFSHQRRYGANLSDERLEEELGKVNPNVKENKIILLTILNPVYSLNVDIIHKICRENGQVDKIVMFERGNVVHALVQFSEVAAAITAKTNLHGANIFPDCCTIKVEFAKQEVLNVKTNDDRTRDFTIQVAKGMNGGSQKQKLTRKVLITDPVNGNGTHGNGIVNGNGYHENNQDDLSHYSPSQSNGHVLHVHRNGFHDMYEPRTETSPVVIVYNLDSERFNCKRLFNLLSLYGNVNKINFIRSKDGCAMAEFASSLAASEAIKLLNNISVFGNRINIELSRKMYVEEIRSPYDLPNGDKSFENFIGDRNNRFNTPQQAAKNRLMPPTKTLHFYNVPKMDEDSMMDIFTEANAPFPVKITWFDVKSPRGAVTGLVAFESVEEACEALIMVNNLELEAENSSRPYSIKLCFARNAS